MVSGENRGRGRARRALAALIVGWTLLTVPTYADAQATVANSARTASPISAPAYKLPPEKLVQARALGRIRPALHFGEEFWQLAFLWLLLASGRVARLERQVARITSRPWMQAALFSATLLAVLYFAVDLPIGAIGHAVSLRYGISVETWPAWLADEAKTLGLTLLLEVPSLLLAFGLMHWGWSRRRVWFWFAAATAPMLLLGAFLLPAVVEPLFFTYEPLASSHPALAQELEKVVARTGTSNPPERMFLMKASEKSNGLNAYVSGLGSTRRIVVWDTTADRLPTDEILAIFAHESGHYVLHHIVKGLVLASIGCFAFFWAVARFAEWLVGRFGSRWRVNGVDSVAGLAVLLLAFALLQAFTEPLENGLSRHFEHEADVYGQEAIHGLVPDPRRSTVAAFNALGEAYLDDPNPNPFVVFWTYSHPSIQQRATFAAHYDPWALGQKPRFFPK